MFVELAKSEIKWPANIDLCTVLVEANRLKVTSEALGEPLGLVGYRIERDHVGEFMRDDPTIAIER